MSDKDQVSASAFLPDPALAEQVSKQIDRLISSKEFTENAHRRALLRYVVDETLAGRGHLLKGFTVAQAVFGRNENFDQQSDPIVRIEAGRLRKDLERYFAGAGRGDPLRISIPKGGYVPHFEVVTSPEKQPSGMVGDDATDAADTVSQSLQSRAKPQRRLAGAGAILLCVGVIAGLLAWQRNVGPTNTEKDAIIPTISVVVLPFSVLGGDERSNVLAEGLTQEVISDLMRFSGLRLYTSNPSFRQDPTADPTTLANELGVSYIVRGGVAAEQGHLRVVADLVEADGHVVWSQTFDRALTTDSVLGVQGAVSADIATALGQSYGPLKTDVLARKDLQQPGLDDFFCLLEARAYRRTFDPAMHAPVMACLQQAVAQQPSYAEAWAMLGWLCLDEVRFNLVPAASAARTMDEARNAAARALRLDPENVAGLQALAAIDYYSGNFDNSESLMRNALRINPNDPETLVQMGWRLSARGKWDEGIPLVEQAIARTVRAPGWYFHAIAAHAYIEGDYAAAIAAAERSAINGSEFGWLVIAASQAALGNTGKATEAVAQMRLADAEMAENPAAVLRSHQLVEPTVAALVQGLRTAGWTPQ